MDNRGVRCPKPGLFSVATLLALSGCAVVRPVLEPLLSEPEKTPPPKPAASKFQADRAPPPAIPWVMATPADAIVRVVGHGVACSGTMIEEDLVLTAHHCVAQRNGVGDIVRRDVEPETLRVELGGDYLPWGEVEVRAIVAPPCGHAAGVGDIAVLVLKRKLVGAPTLRARLGQAPEAGERVHAVGFGRCALSPDGIRRRSRVGGAIGDVFQTRFHLSAAICPGDSGGPALAAGGTVVGVTSASAMDGSEETTGRTEFTRLDAWRAVFSNAKLIADGAEASELPPIDGCKKE